MGSTIVRTPNLDRLAAEGTVFPFGYSTASVCRPALRSLLTGLDPYQRGQLYLMRGAEGLDVGDREDPTIAQLLAGAGYASFMAGKLPEPFEQAGFTDGTSQTSDALYVASDFGRPSIQAALDFIDRHRDEPFFLWFAPMLPHVPHDAPEPYRSMYGDVPAHGYYANITRFDDVVGRLLAHLERRDLSRHTVVVFLCDNGWDPRYDQRERSSKRIKDDGPHGKDTMFELGFRTPVIFRWPGTIPAATTREDLISLVDVFPTLLSFAGVPPPPGTPGFDLKPLLLDGSQPGPSRKVIVGRRGQPRDPPRADDQKPKHGSAFFVGSRDSWYVWYPERETDAYFDFKRDPTRMGPPTPLPSRLRALRRSQARGWQRRMMKLATERLRTDPTAPTPSARDRDDASPMIDESRDG